MYVIMYIPSYIYKLRRRLEIRGRVTQIICGAFFFKRE